MRTQFSRLSKAAVTYASAVILLAACGGGGDAGQPDTSEQYNSEIGLDLGQRGMPATPTAVAAVNTTSTTSWTQCATENGSCTFSGSREVRYGANSTWVTRVANGPVKCDNSVFGDPLPGVDKVCQIASISTPVAPPPTVSWTQCATENGSCTFSGSREVRYGANSKWVTRVANRSIKCDNSVFGDPLPGVDKVCQIASTTSTPAPAPTPTPTPTVSWAQCATENGTCSFSGSREVRYGANSTWVKRVATGSLKCDNSVFGDPLPGVDKVCQVASTTTGSPTTPSTPAPAPTPAPDPTPPPAGNAVAPKGQDASQYALTFSDEFDNGFNTSKWNSKIWYDGDNPTKNYTVEDGKLKIWPQRDASGKFFDRTIDTDGKFYQTYGFFEMEAKLPNGKGPWPAFWLLNHDRPHPHRPEIDIMEAYSGGGPNSGWSDGALKPTAYAATVWPTGIQNGASAGHRTMQNLGDLSAGFHTYGVKWEPNRITFYFDGKVVHTINASMSDRMYVLLDLWFGSASGTPDNSTPTGKGNAFEVNYVRVWQFK